VRRRSLLAPEGLIVPHNLVVRCELIESEFLYKCSRVESDSRQIADFINIYEVNSLWTILRRAYHLLLYPENCELSESGY